MKTTMRAGLAALALMLLSACGGKPGSAQDTLSVEEVGQRLGFSEVTNFRKAFRKWTGQSPGAFRGALQLMAPDIGERAHAAAPPYRAHRSGKGLTMS